MIARRISSQLDAGLAHVFTQGAVAFVVKVLAALLSFLMFMAISRVLPETAFGQFGFAFSLVTMLSLIGSLGQRSMILRFAGAYQADASTERLNAVIQFGYKLVLAGCALTAALLLLPAFLMPGLPDYLYASAAFTLVLGFAEYQAHALRSFGSMARALVPRDLVWRAGVIGVAWLSIADVIPMRSASDALWACALVLLIVATAQMVLTPSLRAAISARNIQPLPERKTWLHAAAGLWGTSIVLAAGPNLSVVLLGLQLSPDEVGPLFAALRTSMLLSLFLMAANMIAAPLIARDLALGNLPKVQRLCTFIAIAVGIPTLAVYLGLCLFGSNVLELFGPEFGEARAALIVLSTGYLVSALAGPNSQVMEMAGAERKYLRILAITTLISLLSLPLLVAMFGATGAAMGIAGGMIASNIWTTRYCVRQLHIRPGLLPGRVVHQTPKERGVDL